MEHASDLIVKYLCTKSAHARAFRDGYQVPSLLELWRNYVSREDRFNRYAEMTSHGPCHMEGVAALVADLALPYRTGRSRTTTFLNDSELFVLLAVAHLHDVGMYCTFDEYYDSPMMIRTIHGFLSTRTVLRESHLLLPTLEPAETRLIALLCAYHQGKAALSEADLLALAQEKRMKVPQMEGFTRAFTEHPSLQRALEDACRQGSDPFTLSRTGEAICPFILATLIKFLDGCDFQASRVESIEAVFRHADRNQSHVARSRQMLCDTTPGTPTYQRTSKELDFFRGSVFHFLRNLLIEKTLMLTDPATQHARIVIKPADFDATVRLARMMIDAMGQLPGVSSDGTVQRLHATLSLLQHYQQDHLATMAAALEVEPMHESLREWQVAGAGAPSLDQQDAHFLVARNYIARELTAVQAALASPSADREYHFCACCPARATCSLKHRPIPSFQREDGLWDITPYQQGDQVQLPQLPSLGGVRSVKQPSAVGQPSSVQQLVTAMQARKRVLFYGPQMRNKMEIATTAVRKHVNDHPAQILAHVISDDTAQHEALIHAFAGFFAIQGEFSLANFIRGGTITPIHEQAVLDLLRSGLLAGRKQRYALVLENFNRLQLHSRRFFKQVSAFFPCVSCPLGRSCTKSEPERWECHHQESSMTLLVSTKIPGGHWQDEFVGGLPICTVAAQPLPETTLPTQVARLVGDRPIAHEIAAIWGDYGCEPIGMSLLMQQKAMNWDDAHRRDRFECEMIDILRAEFSEKALADPLAIPILKLIALLDGTVTPDDVIRIATIPTAADEGALHRLLDRGLIQLCGGRLFSHPAFVQGHRRSGWVDRLGDHPWPMLVSYIGLGDQPADGLRTHWEDIKAYAPELAALEGITGGTHHQLDALEHSLQTLSAIDELVIQWPASLPQYADALQAELRDTGGTSSRPWSSLHRLALIRIAALFHDIAKPHTRKEVSDKVSFIEHERLGAQHWRAIAAAYSMPVQQADAVEYVLLHHLHAVELLGNAEASTSALDHFLRKAGDQLYPLLLLGAADLLASSMLDMPLAALFERIGRVLDRRTILENAREQQAVASLRGHDLLQAGMLPGPAFGKALSAVNTFAREDPTADYAQLLAHAQSVYEAYAIRDTPVDISETIRKPEV